jgi:2-polyprenyl-3-methyl-5-hydroxy-6-metoxy-1,4-benzoquinol methylase
VTIAPTVVGLTPADVKRLGNAFCHAKLLLTASELGLFADLDSHGASSAEELGGRLGLHPRGRHDFLTALVALGLLVIEDGRYANSDVASSHLIPGGATYMGGFLNRANRVLYPAYANLTDALRTGRPQVPAAADGEFERMLADPQQSQTYLRMMDSVNGLVAPLLLAAYDFIGHTDLVDVGGCRGNLSANIWRAYPQLSATVFDLPAMGQHLAAHMATMDPVPPVAFRGGNFFVDDLPSGDVITCGHVLHNWSPEERQIIIRKAFAAVRPGGVFMVYDAMLDEDHIDLAATLVSINMLLVTQGGSEYPISDAKRWFAEAGFVDIEARPLGTTDTLVIGRKPLNVV